MAKQHVFDVRTLERNFQKGIITRAQYEEFLGKLDDAEGNSMTVQAEFVEGVFDRGSSRRASAPSRTDDVDTAGSEEE